MSTLFIVIQGSWTDIFSSFQLILPSADSVRYTVVCHASFCQSLFSYTEKICSFFLVLVGF